MCHLVPFNHELFHLGLEQYLRRKISNTKPFPLEKRKPLRDLIPPTSNGLG